MTTKRLMVWSQLLTFTFLNPRPGTRPGYRFTLGLDRLIKDIIDSKEYAEEFGEQGVPHPSLNQHESSGCQQVS